MADFSITINNVDALQNAYKQAPQIVRPIIQQAIERAPDILASYTIPGIVPYRTGQLIQTFRRDVQDMMARWFPTVKYAPFVEYGTAPHVILPINKKALFWPSAAHPVRKVNHPGSKANPYMERIRDAATQEINQTFEQAMDVITQKLANP